MDRFPNGDRAVNLLPDTTARRRGGSGHSYARVPELAMDCVVAMAGLLNDHVNPSLVVRCMTLRKWVARRAAVSVR